MTVAQDDGNHSCESTLSWTHTHIHPLIRQVYQQYYCGLQWNCQ